MQILAHSLYKLDKAVTETIYAAVIFDKALPFLLILGLNALAAEAVEEAGAASETGVGHEDAKAQVDKSEQTEKAEKSDKAEKSEKGSKVSDAVQWPWLYRTIIERPPSSLKPSGAALAAAMLSEDTVRPPINFPDAEAAALRDRTLPDIALTGPGAEPRCFRHILVNAFAFGGSNVSLLLGRNEEPSL